MKNLMFLTISLALVIGVSSGRAWAQDKCTRGVALELHTAIALAQFYAGTAEYDARLDGTLDSKKYQIQKNYEAAITKAAKQLPDKCLIELLTAKGNDQCTAFFSAAIARQQNRMVSIGQESLENSDPEFLTPKFRELMRLVLESIPRSCWFQPISQATQPASQGPGPKPCPWEWSRYNDCNEENKKIIGRGIGSSAGFTRELVNLCFKPACPEW